jgi:antitoxin component YwqK of YwqJK toxin-antitoxin module
MKIILSYKLWISESISATSSQNTDPDIDYSQDREGNPVEFNRKKRIEITYHPTKKDQKGNRIPIKKGKYDRGENKTGVWEQWDLDKGIHQKMVYVDDKLHGINLITFTKGDKDQEIQYWEEGVLKGKKIDYRNGSMDQINYEDELQKEYTVQKFDPSGKKTFQGSWSSGQKDGLHQWWKNGQFCCSMNYQRGKPTGWGEDPQGKTIKGSLPKK